MFMNTPGNHSEIKKILTTFWKTLKPLILFVTVLLILRYTGALAGISSAANQAVLMTGVLNADPDKHPTKNEAFNYDFKIKTLDGKEIDFNTYRGKTIFLNMWATWCGPCRAEMPSIQSLYDKVNNDSVVFVMLSIDAEGHPEKVSKYVDAKGFTFPVFIAGDLPPQLQVKTIPSTFVISKDGTLEYTKSGMAEYDTKSFRKFLEKLTINE
jgi:thiol-disulfide isomerase/thioredoxin